MGSSLVLLVKLATRTLGEAIPEDDAIAVIGLVLQTPREESGAGDRERIAPRILPLAGGMVGTCQRAETAGPRQAPLLGGDEATIPALGQRDDGVADGSVVHDIVVVGADVHEQRNSQANLGGCEPHTVGSIHRGEHVTDEVVQVGVEVGDRFGPGM